jgi:hypothetical protein
MAIAERDWAEEEFGLLEADTRMVRRLVRVAERAAERPDGLVTRVFARSDEREGAFRLLENRRLSSAAVAGAAFDAAVSRCTNSCVYVPIDGSSLKFTERTATRELGGIGAWKEHGRGLLVGTALAVASNGVPLGVCGQQWWVRNAPSKGRRKAHRSMEGETRHSVALLESVHARFRAMCPSAVPWYQLDRGYDVWPILQFACREHMRLTVRAIGTRHVFDPKGIRRPLPRILEQAPVLGDYTVSVPARPNRPAREARMRIQVCTVSVPLAVGKKRRELVRLQAVLAKEIDYRGKDRLRWMLFTTVGVNSFEDAVAVIRGYTMRWRIEDFHRTWKKGLCNVEDSQLRSREALVKWATILATVAARANRLTLLARQVADHVPATDEFSRHEIDAIVLLREPKGFRVGNMPSLKQAIRWVADLGGYTGKSSGGPPGATVIGRGLADIAVLARGLENLQKRRNG